MTRLIFLIASLLMAGGATAQISRDTVAGVSRNSMVWSGPDDIYPRVAHVRAGERVWLHGCLQQYAWCDISTIDGVYRSRGWIPANALFIPWQGHRYPLTSHGIWQRFPRSDFVLSIYWGTHYPRSPWYHDRSRFGRHDWRRDQWRWDHHDRHNDRRALDQQDAYRQRVIEQRRRADEQQSSGRDRDGLTPLQRQIELQSQRARDIQRQREERQRSDRIPESEPAIEPMPDQAGVAPARQRERIRENARSAIQRREDVRQIEQEP